ncbi:ribosomal protection-like ABC-F family protein [Exiguobacterium sp. s193]|uniref:ribosomal protection-like ABC-F family protein n=1 Tax=Exiguobacterium sp. s193 TaxID=2751207 RepID=UPI001BE818C2|nr:ABC-F type ribosomal protection protein [Exiguobacterium sp. s193]
MPTEVLSIHDLQIDFADQRLFHDVTFSIRDGEHVALVGPNGVGKTTLLRAILKEIIPTTGTIHRTYERIGLLAQQIEPSTNLAIQIVEQADVNRYDLRERALTTESVDDYQAAVDADAFTLEADARRVLKEVQLEQSLWFQPLNTLSGGEQTRIQLACLLLKKPDFILLDEPTNHLDEDTLEWLVAWTRQTKTTMLYVSHERAFIDATADAVIELTEAGAARYEGNYEIYRTLKEQERTAQWHQYEKQERTRKELTRMIGQYRNWHQKATASASERDPYAKKKAAKHATKVKAKENQLERLLEHQVKKPETPSSIHVRFEAEDFLAKRLVSVDALSFDYPHRQLFHEMSFSIQRGDRIALIGRNGSGKTTLLRLLLGELSPTAGTVTHHPALKIGYFSQVLSTLPKTGTLLDALLETSEISETDARTLLACFLFRRETVHKPIAQASMGEKCRIAFLRLYFSGAHLLILDEPTNYLDLATREQIEAALEVFPGELLFVSHDRYFTDRLSNRTISLTDDFTIHSVGTKILREQRASDSEVIRADLRRLNELTGEIDFDA